MKRVLPLTGVLLAIAAQPATAAYPGTNGSLAAERPSAAGAATQQTAITRPASPNSELEREAPLVLMRGSLP